MLQEAIEVVLLLTFFQAVDQRCGSKETYASSCATSGQAERNCQVRFSSTASADEATVPLFLDPLATGQLEDLLFSDATGCREVKRVQVLVDWKTSLLDTRLQCIGRSAGNFQFGQPQQVIQVTLIRIRRFLRQLAEFGQHRR